MRILLLVCVLACSKKAPPPPETLESLISADVTSVLRTDNLEFFPVLAVSRDIFDPQQVCWADLVKRTTAGYQMLVEGDSYFVVEGDLPREDVEKCVKVALVLAPKIKEVDEMLGFETPSGTVYAAWRGKYVVFGQRLLVAKALEPAPADVTSRWAKLLPATKAEMHLVSTDVRAMGALIGASLTDWALVMDKATRQPPFFGGRFVAHYQTADDATKGAQWVASWSKDAKWPVRIDAADEIVAVFDGIAGAIAKMKMTVTGNELVLAFDSDQLGGPAVFATAFQNIDKAMSKMPKR